jgi:tRNA G37 N-methylase Trm5
MLINILIIIQTLLVLAFACLLIYIAYVMFSFRNIVPFVPTPGKIIKKMIKLAQIQKNERVCDLGSGTGKIIIAVARKHRQNLIMGIEKSLFLRSITYLKLIFHPLLRRQIQIVNQDFFNLDLHNFDVIFCFITPEAIRILTPRFKLIKRNSRIITYMFPLEDSDGFEEKIVHPTAKDSIYLYTKI